MTTPYGRYDPSTTLHGEIISWGIPARTRVPFSTVKAAIAAAGFADKFAREMYPANAFARAAKDLSDRQLIRQIEETASEIRFQFSSERRDGEGLAYDRAAILTLNKVTGDVACSSPELAVKAQAAIAEQMGTRNTSDIHVLICRLFEKNADLFPVRDAGGVYFVPATFKDFLDRIDGLMHDLCGTRVRRFPVPAGFPVGDRSVAESVESGMLAAVDAHVKAIEKFDETTRESTMEKTVERINMTRFKLEAYAQYLGDKRDQIEDAIKAARKVLRAKITALGGTVAVPEPDGTIPADEPPVVVGPVTVQVPAAETAGETDLWGAGPDRPVTAEDEAFAAEESAADAARDAFEPDAGFADSREETFEELCEPPVVREMTPAERARADAAAEIDRLLAEIGD